MSVVQDEPTTVVAEAEALIREARRRQNTAALGHCCSAGRRDGSGRGCLERGFTGTKETAAYGFPSQRAERGHDNGTGMELGRIDQLLRQVVRHIPRLPQLFGRIRQVSGTTGTNGWALT